MVCDGELVLVTSHEGVKIVPVSSSWSAEVVYHIGFVRVIVIS